MQFARGLRNGVTTRRWWINWWRGWTNDTPLPPSGWWLGQSWALGSESGIIHDPSSLPSNPTQVKAVLPTANESAAVSSLCPHLSYARPLNNNHFWSAMARGRHRHSWLVIILCCPYAMRRDAPYLHTVRQACIVRYPCGIAWFAKLWNCAVSLRTEVSIKWASPQRNDSWCKPRRSLLYMGEAFWSHHGIVRLLRRVAGWLLCLTSLCSMLDARCLMLDAWCLVLGACCLLLVAYLCLMDHGCWEKGSILEMAGWLDPAQLIRPRHI